MKGKYRIVVKNNRVVHGIQVRQQPMAQAKKLAHGVMNFFFESPRLFSVEFTAAAVQTVDRRKDAELIPARFHLIVLVSQHMTADIMTPPSITDVGCRAGKIGLEIQRFPGNQRVTAGRQHSIRKTQKTASIVLDFRMTYLLLSYYKMFIFFIIIDILEKGKTNEKYCV